ncbi:MAG: hypothetical protein ACW98X_08935 [Promethearchaeota archaeon]|jgi:hypothetical protein
MDKFVWLNTTTGKSYLNLADISVISFNNGNEFCDIHMRSGTIFTTDAESGHSLFERHEDYIISKATAKIYEVSA